jgi:hypothetical protein
MPTTDPAPEWDWYSSRDLSVGEHRASFHDFLDEAELEEVMDAIQKKEKRRIPVGFQLPKVKKRKRRKKKRAH